MYIEKRKTKQYLVHSYRDNNKVKKIRKYLGKNPSKEQIKKAKEQIQDILKEINTKVFNFYLTKNQIKKLNNYENQIKIHHLERINWKRFTEEFTYNTNAIEGSTIQLEEIPEILKKKQTKDPEEIETKGVAEAIEYTRTTKENLSIELIKKLHKICFKNSKSFAGNFRKVEVVIKDAYGHIVHAGIPNKEINKHLRELIEFYNKNKNNFKPLIFAAIIHNQFEHIHPFQDGNGRVGRLLLNFILLKNKYPPINIKLEDRKEYYISLQEYSKKDNLIPTMRFLIKQYNKTLKKLSTKNKS
jgi:Fic family protein